MEGTGEREGASFGVPFPEGPKRDRQRRQPRRSGTRPGSHVHLDPHDFIAVPERAIRGVGADRAVGVGRAGDVEFADAEVSERRSGGARNLLGIIRRERPPRALASRGGTRGGVEAAVVGRVGRSVRGALICAGAAAPRSRGPCGQSEEADDERETCHAGQPEQVACPASLSRSAGETELRVCRTVPHPDRRVGLECESPEINGKSPRSIPRGGEIET